MENFVIEHATEADREALLSLYHSLTGGKAGWDEAYPSLRTIDFDLGRDSLFVMRAEDGGIVSAITIDEDPNVEALPCWTPELLPGGELSRVAVRAELQGQGLARQMMGYALEELKRRGKKSAHLLVVRDHEVALRSYSKFDYRVVGETDLYEEDFLCLEKAL